MCRAHFVLPVPACTQAVDKLAYWTVTSSMPTGLHTAVGSLNVDSGQNSTRSSAVAVIADRTACSSSLRSAKTTIGPQRDFYFNAIHCDCSVGRENSSSRFIRFVFEKLRFAFSSIRFLRCVFWLNDTSYSKSV